MTITGTNFTGATAVAFNGTSATFTVASARQINTTVPAGAGSGPITVTTPNGTATSTTGGAPGQVSFVSVGVARATSGATSLALTLPSGYQAGDLLVAWLSFGDNAQAMSGMTGWTELPWSPLDDGTLWHARAFYKIAVSGEVAPTVRWTNNTKAIIQTGAWRGVNQASPIVASGGALDLTSTTSVAGPAVTNTLASAWAIAFFSFRTTNNTNSNTTYFELHTGWSDRPRRLEPERGRLRCLGGRRDRRLGRPGRHRQPQVHRADHRRERQRPQGRLADLRRARGGSGGNFTVTGPTPTITSFNPTSGSAGTAVTITGTNLSGATAVAFNGTSATFTVASATQINTTVPTVQAQARSPSPARTAPPPAPATSPSPGPPRRSPASAPQAAAPEQPSPSPAPTLTAQPPSPSTAPAPPSPSPPPPKSTPPSQQPQHRPDHRHHPQRHRHQHHQLHRRRRADDLRGLHRLLRHPPHRHHDDETQSWLTSPNVVFVAQPDSPSGGWDSSALRIENLSATPLTNVVVSVDIGSHHFALWGTNTIPVGSSLILAQTSFQNFDGSDTSPAGCYGCDPMLCITSVSSTIPVVT